jgi:hypothetical protein
MNANENLSLEQLEEQVREQVAARAGYRRRVVATTELRRCVSDSQRQHAPARNVPTPAPVAPGGLLTSFKRLQEDRRRQA